MKSVSQAIIPADAAYFDGHFPGRALVPAVVILELVRECMAPAAAVATLREPLQFAKFVAPVLPGDRLTIEVQQAGGTRAFRCLVDGRLVAHEAFGCAGT